MKKIVISAVVGLLIIFSIFVYTKLTFFVVQPIGAIPNGVTAITWKKGNLKFVESPDSMCFRTSGEVSLLCRGMTIASVINNNEVIYRLPYSNRLYLISTNGKELI
ncbi:hypothetical protein [Budvicia aquatica]|uniref:Uncharacterized protein n=1 Tax=Budvicia aquatica TaxID=82979 RepID=A0A2C6DRR6_9GAMM|nr:hypothetical protein [Budvicia aquatica]PHI31511.1 hypothetical protein CRN84_20285 [Budvicia aquatica]VFS51924.1 Uncharacterised protein [Budvicia aquatica]